MLRVMCRLLLIGVVAFTWVTCLAQPKHEMRVDIVLRGAETVPVLIRKQMISEVRKGTRNAAITDALVSELGERLLDQFQQHGYFKAEIFAPENWRPEHI